MTGDAIDAMRDAWATSAPGLDTSPLDVAGRLLRLAAGLQRSIEAALAPLGLSYGDFDVLNTLRRESRPDGMLPGELARAMLITSGAVASRLTRLERAGLLTRETDAADRRAVRVRLTPAGASQATLALDAVLAADRMLLAPLGDDRQVRLAAELRTLLLAAEAPTGA